jgi:hypothetical protein
MGVVLRCLRGSEMGSMGGGMVEGRVVQVRWQDLFS